MHALQRMLQRGISREHVKAVMLNGDVIEAYATADPYPSGLIHGVINDRALHVVAAWDGSEAQLAYVITVYEPDEAHFEPDLRTRRRKLND